MAKTKTTEVKLQNLLRIIDANASNEDIVAESQAAIAEYKRQQKQRSINRSFAKRKWVGQKLPDNHINNKRKVYREEYLKSEHWTALKSEKLNKQIICEKCGATKYLDVHHLRYKNLYDVKLTDLQVLCRACHSAEHEIIDKHKNIFDKYVKDEGPDLSELTELQKKRKVQKTKEGGMVQKPLIEKKTSNEKEKIPKPPKKNPDLIIGELYISKLKEPVDREFEDFYQTKVEEFLLTEEGKRLNSAKLRKRKDKIRKLARQEFYTLHSLNGKAKT